MFKRKSVSKRWAIAIVTIFIIVLIGGLFIVKLDVFNKSYNIPKQTENNSSNKNDNENDSNDNNSENLDNNASLPTNNVTNTNGNTSSTNNNSNSGNKTNSNTNEPAHNNNNNATHNNNYNKGNANTNKGNDNNTNVTPDKNGNGNNQTNQIKYYTSWGEVVKKPKYSSKSECETAGEQLRLTIKDDEGWYKISGFFCDEIYDGNSSNRKLVGYDILDLICLDYIYDSEGNRIEKKYSCNEYLK